MTDRLAELGALQYAVENLSTSGTSPNRLALAGYIHAAYTDYQAWAAANPGVNPDRLSARGRLYGYFYDNASWSPSSLFAASEVGAWYDPSDLTTMFQDRAGTTPVTADGQTVGLVLDKSKGLTLGSELVTNGGFDTDTGWTLLGDGSQSVVSGKLRVVAGATAGTTSSQSITLTGGKWYKITGTMSAVVGTRFRVLVGGSGWRFVELDSTNTPSGIVSSVFYVTTSDTYDIQLAPSTFAVHGSSGDSADFDNISVREIQGNHAVAPSDAARPLYKTDGTYHWLQFDGVDDSLSTAAINFTATNKMSIWCGAVQNNTTAMLADIGASSVGSTYLFYNSVPQFEIGRRASGSEALTFTAVKTSSVKYVTTSGVDFAQPTEVFAQRVNGASSGSVGSSDTGSGNFGNYPIYIGSRSGSSLRLNGNIYSLIIRGALSTTQEITDTEAWVNSKTGAF